MDEFKVARVPLVSTRTATDVINKHWEDGYEPFLMQSVSNDIVILFRVKRKPGRPPKDRSEERSEE